MTALLDPRSAREWRDERRAAARGALAVAVLARLATSVACRAVMFKQQVGHVLFVSSLSVGHVEWATW